MMLLVVLGHAMLPHAITRSFHMVADPSQSPVIDFLLFFFLNLIMSAFFLAAGFLAASSMLRNGRLSFLRKRALRILVPFAVLWLLFSPIITAVVDLAHLISVEQSVSVAWTKLLADLRPEWSRIWHLWFLPALLIYYVVWTTFSAALEFLVNRRPENLLVPLAGHRLNVAIALPLVPVFFAMGSDVESTLNGIVYLWFFIVGVYLFSNQGLITELEDRTWSRLGAGLCLVALAWAGLWPTLKGEHPDTLELSLMLGVLRAFGATFLVLGAVGLCFRYGRVGAVTIAYVAGASYWIYLMHFPLVRFSSGLLSLIDLPVVVKLFVNVGSAVAILLVAWEFFVRRTRLGEVLGARDQARQPMESHKYSDQS